MLANNKDEIQNEFTKMGTTTLKFLIIGAALFFIGIAIFVDNPWILAGALAYEVLP